MTVKLLAYLRECDSVLPCYKLVESQAQTTIASKDLLASIQNGHIVLVSRRTWNAILNNLDRKNEERKKRGTPRSIVIHLTTSEWIAVNESSKAANTSVQNWARGLIGLPRHASFFRYRKCSEKRGLRISLTFAEWLAVDAAAKLAKLTIQSWTRSQLGLPL